MNQVKIISKDVIVRKMKIDDKEKVKEISKDMEA